MRQAYKSRDQRYGNISGPQYGMGGSGGGFSAVTPADDFDDGDDDDADY